MAHVTVDVGEYRVSAPGSCGNQLVQFTTSKSNDQRGSIRTHEQPESQWNSRPVLWEGVCFRRLKQGTGLVRLNETINENGENDCGGD